MNKANQDAQNRPSRMAMAAFAALFLALGLLFVQTLDRAEANIRLPGAWIMGAGS